jgi:hypothetical protein
VNSLWKSLQGPGDDWPLALCDVRTVDYEKDIVSQDLVFADRLNENSRVYYNKKQAWYYYPNLRDDEIIVFQQMDSRFPSGKGKIPPIVEREIFQLTCRVGVPHSGFMNPFADQDAAPRVSIEIRVFVYFE